MPVKYRPKWVKRWAENQVKPATFEAGDVGPTNDSIEKAKGRNHRCQRANRYANEIWKFLMQINQEEEEEEEEEELEEFDGRDVAR